MTSVPDRTHHQARTARRRRRLDIARDWLQAGGSVLVFGAPCTEPSTVLDLLTGAVSGSFGTLRARSRGAGAAPFQTLADLLGPVADSAPDHLPAADRTLLRRALTGTADPDEAGAVGLAALRVLRPLARRQPLVLVLDGIHEMDRASAVALRFVTARVDDLPVSVAAAETVATDALPGGRLLCPQPLMLVRLDHAAGRPARREEDPDEDERRYVGSAGSEPPMPEPATKPLAG
jgi:hypothetical protein